MERSTVVGVFRERDAAEHAIDELHRIGFRDDQIGFVMRGGEGTTGTTTTETGGHAGEGAVGGILAGAGIGGLIAAAASLLIPGFGPVIAGGILATILGGAAIGAAAGGILGALVGMGVPEEEAHYYESEFNEGRMLVTVKADGRYQEARDILRRNGAYDIEDRDAVSTGRTTMDTTPRTGTTMRTETTVHDQEQERLRLHEEELRARTQPVQTGEVTVSKEVVTEHQQIDVPVKREEVVIERHPVEGRPGQGELRPGEEIRVPVHEERVTVEKQPVAYEEVSIGKRTTQETEHVTGEVRREEARIEHDGDVPVHGTGTTGLRSWQDMSPQWRQRWQTRYGTSGGRWEESEPYYRYGYEMANDARFRDRDWAQVEPDLKRDYGAWAQRGNYQYDDNAWERFKDRVHESWDDARGMRRAA
jgi:uncharacterized protein (TIGR02271 family)